jgi:hypothetical protein
VPAASASPQEERLADLRKKQESLDWRIAMEMELARKLASDALNLSTQPLPDPDERRYLMESMDKQKQTLARLAEEKKAIDGEIGKESRKSTCFDYAPSPDATFRGSISQKTFATENGNEPETVWVLALDTPICTNAGSEQEDRVEGDVIAMQLLFTESEMYDRYRDQLGKPVAITGWLFHALTAHHHTSVMLQVKDIKPQS